MITAPRPGLTSMREDRGPWAEHLEDLTTLLHAAAASGITSIVALPDARPVIDDASMIDRSACARPASAAHVCSAWAATHRMKGGDGRPG